MASRPTGTSRPSKPAKPPARREAAAAAAPRAAPRNAPATDTAKAKATSAAGPRKVLATPLAAAAASPRKRPPGRPGGDAANLRAPLLDAAIACFVRHGIAATSLRAIATEAGVTPAMLHYYFGAKHQLVQAVIAERLLPATGQLRATLLAAGDDIAALVAAFVRGIGEVVVQHPWLPSLWVREVLSEGGALREVMLSTIAPQLPLMLAARFAEAQKKGALNPDLDPRLAVVSLVGLTLFPLASAPIWRRMFTDDALDAESLCLHTLALLDRGMGMG